MAAPDPGLVVAEGPERFARANHGLRGNFIQFRAGQLLTRAEPEAVIVINDVISQSFVFDADHLELDIGCGRKRNAQRTAEYCRAAQAGRPHPTRRRHRASGEFLVVKWRVMGWCHANVIPGLTISGIRSLKEKLVR
jgi:hypothetical protein